MLAFMSRDQNSPWLFGSHLASNGESRFLTTEQLQSNGTFLTRKALLCRTPYFLYLFGSLICGNKLQELCGYRFELIWMDGFMVFRLISEDATKCVEVVGGRTR